MSHHGSEQEEAKCWIETSMKTHPDEWMEEAATMEEPQKLRWSVGMGKKDWERRTHRFTHGSRKLGWKHEMKLQYYDDEQGTGRRTGMLGESVPYPRDIGRHHCFCRRCDGCPGYSTSRHPNQGKCPENWWKGNPVTGAKGIPPWC